MSVNKYMQYPNYLFGVKNTASFFIHNLSAYKGIGSTELGETI